MNDDGIFFNHSVDRNVDPGTGEGELDTYKVKDIQRGDELVDDYFSYDYPEWLQNHLFDKYKIWRTWL